MRSGLKQKLSITQSTNSTEPGSQCNTVIVLNRETNSLTFIKQPFESKHKLIEHLQNYLEHSTNKTIKHSNKNQQTKHHFSLRKGLFSFIPGWPQTCYIANDNTEVLALLFPHSAWFYINLTQARVFREEEASIEKMPLLRPS